MREDIRKISDNFLLKETVEAFGEPSKGSSFIYIRCLSCGTHVRMTITSLKKALSSDRKPSSCKPCRTSISSKKLWEDSAYKEKHSRACSESYADGSRGKLVSETNKRAWKDPSYREKMNASKKAMWERPEYREKQAAFRDDEYREARASEQREKWNDPSYRRKMTEQAIRYWENPENRKRTSDSMKAVWASGDFRAIQSEIQSRRFDDPVFRASMEAIWADPEYRHSLSLAMKRKWEDDDFRKKCSEAAVRRWLSPGYRDAVVAGVKKKWGDDAYRTLRSDQSKAMWANEEHRKKSGLARASQSGKKSSIELVTESILRSLGLEFFTQVPVGPYLFDFFIPTMGLYIECQGEYWHSLPGRPSRDRAKLSYLEKASPEARISYLHERDFMNPGSVMSKILTSVGVEKIDVEDFDFHDVSISAIDRSSYTLFLDSFHYAASGRSSAIAYGAHIGEELVAVCKFSPVVRREVATSMGLSARSVLELDRFCIKPSRQKKNFASWMVARSSSMAFVSRPDVSHLVSFADATFGHSGTIYTAANWEPVSVVPPDYHYVGQDGWVLHKKTLYNRAVRMSMKEAEYAEKHGYVKSFGKEKRKFVMARPRAR